VLTANAGSHAFTLATTELPNLVVTDYQMPGMTGLELATALGNDSRTTRTPVIMVTARGHRIPNADLMGTNIREIMMKPFSPNELLSRVNEILTQTAPDETPGSSAA
jgi:DNA-binding response OmpR family regulator